MADQAVEWRIDAANSRVVRMITYGWIGLLGGGILLAIGLVLVVAIGAALAGEYAVFALLVVLFLVGGPLSLLYLWPAIRSGSFSPLSQFVVDMASDPAESLGERYERVFSWRGATCAIGVHVIVIPTLTVIGPRVLWGYVGCWFALLVLAAGVVTWGRIDPDTPSFEYRSGEIPLAGVKQAHRLRVGQLEFCWLSYHPGAKIITTSRFVVLTPEASRAFDTARAAVDQSPPDPEPSQPAVTAAAIGIGAGFLAFATVLYVFVEMNPGFARFASLLFGGIGLVFVWIGIAHT